LTKGKHVAGLCLGDLGEPRINPDQPGREFRCEPPTIGHRAALAPATHQAQGFGHGAAHVLAALRAGWTPSCASARCNPLLCLPVQTHKAKTNHMSPKRSLQPCSRHSSLAARGPSAAILPKVRAHNIYPCGFAISQRHCRTCMLWCPECHGPIATAGSYSRPGQFAGRCFLKPCPRIVLTSRSHNRVPRNRRPDTCTQNA